MFCQGINPQAMSPSNMVKFSDQISKALEPMPTLTGGAIGGIVFLSVTAAVLIALVLFFGIKIWKAQNSIVAPKEPEIRQNEEPVKLTVEEFKSF
jgi:type IV secretory pathway TrbD component